MDNLKDKVVTSSGGEHRSMPQTASDGDLTTAITTFCTCGLCVCVVCVCVCVRGVRVCVCV